MRKQKIKTLSSIKMLLGLAVVAISALTYNCSNEKEGIELTEPNSWPTAQQLMHVGMAGDTPSIPVSYTGMDLSFNPGMHVPNWVAWELTGEETKGTVSRKDRFENDPNVAGCAEDYDYLYSGYDRGHMAPAGDMKWSRQAMDETFYLTNICPQAHSLNAGAWLRLEEKCRTWAQADSAIIIVCGPILTDDIHEYLGDSRVAVPKRFFKVILSLHGQSPRAIGFIMNNGYVEGGMQQAAVSVDEVERQTGFDFFSALPDEIENAIESKCEFNLWSNIKPRSRK